MNFSIIRKLKFSITAFIFCVILSVRYRFKIKNHNKINIKKLPKPGGILFLANHPALFVEPALLQSLIGLKFPIRAVIVENMYRNPIAFPLMWFLEAVPISEFKTFSNPSNRKNCDKTIGAVIQELKKGENFIFYPSGGIKITNKEVIGGASGAHKIVQAAPEINIVLVRIKGFWGSLFSRALTGNYLSLEEGIWGGIKIALRNLIFFVPKREIIIEFEPAPADFPTHLPRLEFNRWLERWYNRPDGLSEQEGEYPGESLVLVSYSFWKDDFLEVYQPPKKEEMKLYDVPIAIRKKVNGKLAEYSAVSANEIKPEMNLSVDLGLDSIEISEVIIFIETEFGRERIAPEKIDTVNSLYGFASGKINLKSCAK